MVVVECKCRLVGDNQSVVAHSTTNHRLHVPRLGDNSSWLLLHTKLQLHTNLVKTAGSSGQSLSWFP